MDRFAKSGIVCLLIISLLFFGNVMILMIVMPSGDPNHLAYTTSAITYPLVLISLLGLIISGIGYFNDKRKAKSVKQ